MSTIVIDPEFQALIAPLTAQELEFLEASLLAEGCRDALVVWAGHNVLVDGHNRYILCQKHDLPFRVIERQFDTRADAKVWMILNQLGRRNIAEVVRVKLALALKPALEEQARERQMSGLRQGDENPVVANLPQREKTRDALAQTVGMSSRKFGEVEYVLGSAPPYVLALYEQGEISAHRAYRLTRILERAHANVLVVAARYNVVYPEVVAILERLEENQHKPGSNGTFQDILHTGYIQPGEPEEAVAITATPGEIEAAITIIRRAHIKLNHDEKVLAAQNLPDAVYNVLYADGTGIDLNAFHNYLQEIGLRIADNAALFLWVSPPRLLDGLGLLAAWGFTYQTHFAWFMPQAEAETNAFHIRDQHTLLLAGTRGSFKPLDKFTAATFTSAMPDALRVYPGADDRKPDEVYHLIESLYPRCHYVALLVDSEWPGWKDWAHYAHPRLRTGIA